MTATQKDGDDTEVHLEGASSRVVQTLKKYSLALQIQSS